MFGCRKLSKRFATSLFATYIAVEKFSAPGEQTRKKRTINYMTQFQTEETNL